ncbi:related to histone deacetylase HOS3 [Rhynchosporium secalis]|uniref:Related to histone deacetylase HOS3 n=1 Tax=Rhynchosporium secalis TaxID=38038 RepID=A0A1E1LZ13_RHYSE|nr:related to histone deacetylase HOS3 [Rhynchosporium secalis]
MARDKPPLPPTNSSQAALQQSIRRLSLNQGSPTALPSSSQPSPPARNLEPQRSRSGASPNGRIPPRSPLHRSPSSMSTTSRSSTPTLLRKASMNSLHGVGGVTPSRNSSNSRRSSSTQFNNNMGKSPLSEIEDPRPTPPRHTAASIASNYFKGELELHDMEDDARPADVIVILHDACYGHRYSRPRTSKATLSTIVERPERIHASILGLSVAYVCLGERHIDGQFPLHPGRNATSIPSIPFRIRKTTRKMALSSQAVTNVHGAKWMAELKIMCDNAESRLAMNGKELARPDMNRSPDQATPAKLHEGDLYLCAESLDAMEGALGAVCEGVDAVFQGAASGKGPLRTFVAIRPPGHHCSSSYPSGFCWLNNVHVGISHAALNHGLTHAAIIDFDLHHGDGSQAIAWNSNTRANSASKNAQQWKKTSIGYFSLHDINSYPCEMGDEEKVKNASLCIENAHGQSIWNVHLQPWKSELEFWELYETKYAVLLEKTRNYLRNQTERLRLSPSGPKPKGAIFLSAGFDASEWESSGMQRHKVNVPTEFYARLTSDVVKLAGEEGLGVDGRIISVLEGGYSDRALCTGVLSHLSGMSAGDPMIIKKERSPTGLGYEMVQRIGAYDGIPHPETLTAGSQIQSYDTAWWSVPRLEQLDALIRPDAPAPEPRKPRDVVVPTYSTPTQSFIAKVTSPSARRTISNMGLSNNSPRAVSRAPSPPPPEVDWTVAAHELSKLLVPTERQTFSCRPEELSAEATRARRDRQSILMPSTEPVLENPSSRMALRTRKPAKPLVDSTDEEEKKPNAKTGRRKTVAGAAMLAANTASSRSTTPMPDYTRATVSSHRLSVSSTTGSTISEVPPSLARQNGYRITSTGNGRPGTAQSVRPDSSMSIRGHNQAGPMITVKKTRAPAQPRPEAKTSRTRRKSPLDDSAGTVGTVIGKRTSSSNSVLLPINETASAAAKTPPVGTFQVADMDSLTSGMKKVKISLTTKAQRDAKATAKDAAGINPIGGKSAAAKPTVPKTTRPPPARKQSARKETAILAPVKHHAPVAETNGSTVPVNQDGELLDITTLPATPQSSIPAHLQPPNDVPLPASSPLRPASHGNSTDHPSLAPAQFQAQNQPPQHAQHLLKSTPPPHPKSAYVPTSQPAASTPDIFIPYQPEGPMPTLASSSNSLRWLEPNTGTPSPMKPAVHNPGGGAGNGIGCAVKKADLPVWTSTGAIPFAVQGGLVKDGDVLKGNADVNEKDGDKKGNGEEKEIDIWAVPETPRR